MPNPPVRLFDTHAHFFTNDTSNYPIDITGAEATRYGWQINNGTCAEPGPVVGGRGNYPDVTTDADGRGTIERTFVSEVLTSDREYHAVIVDAATRQTIIACGDLEQKFF